MNKLFILISHFIFSLFLLQTTYAQSEVNSSYRYFIKDDIAYCTDNMHDMTYIPCSDYTIYSFSGQDLVFTATGTNKSFKIKPLYVSRASDSLPAWVTFKGKSELICLDKQARQSGECNIEFIERLDGSFWCIF